MRTLFLCAATFGAGYLLADFMAWNFAKQHDYEKRGGIFSNIKD